MTLSEYLDSRMTNKPTKPEQVELARVARELRKLWLKNQSNLIMKLLKGVEASNTTKCFAYVQGIRYLQGGSDGEQQ